MRVVHPSYRARSSSSVVKLHGKAEVFNASRARGEIAQRSPTFWLSPETLPNRGDVASWPARIGTSTDTQGSAPLRPEARDSVYSGSRLSAFFDSVGEALPMSTLDLSLLSAASVLVAFQRSTSGATGTLFLYGATAGWAGNSIEVGVNASDKLWLTLGMASGADQIQLSVRTISDNNPHVFVVVFDRALTGTNQIKLYDKDGAVAMTEFQARDVTGNFGAAGNCWVGSQNNGAAAGADADIRELALFPSALSEADAVAVARASAWRSAAR